MAVAALLALVVLAWWLPPVMRRRMRPLPTPRADAVREIVVTVRRGDHDPRRDAVTERYRLTRGKRGYWIGEATLERGGGRAGVAPETVAGPVPFYVPPHVVAECLDALRDVRACADPAPFRAQWAETDADYPEVTLALVAGDIAQAFDNGRGGVWWSVRDSSPHPYSDAVRYTRSPGVGLAAALLLPYLLGRARQRLMAT